ncbi:FAD-dependent oxidoreductase [Agrococcus sp. KRD186]|uniref:FAD-dependent oxidoreductase n=1 Tax=Agrococcus sp. KRD186 TaxID=2729730 RepID=UPI0019D0DDA5|nr:FAD-dependent oxidoreductase [Agrococcus sp. KRD186]
MSMLESDVLIIGAGAAGHSAAVTLRGLGFAGSVRIMHDEPHAPYNRTLVDKGLLPGLLTVEQAALEDVAPLGIELVPGRAVAVNPDRRTIRWGVTLLVDSRYQEGTTGNHVYESQDVHAGVQSRRGPVGGAGAPADRAGRA